MARKKDDFVNTIGKVVNDYSLDEIMEDGFGRYSKEIIQERALPDVRDGLKPVQRRILFAMHKAGYTYNKPYQKSAKAVGYIMGNFHPHGDSSIYDALIHLSQPWKMRECFVDIHGNNGSIDGDGPAAMRYTEAKLSKIAETMLEDISKDTVEMTYNFDDTELEPTVLPARFPNLLVNGSSGISAGYATNIPTHNLSEVIDATVKRIESPNCRLDTIMNIIPGPDFPTGGVIEGKEDLIKAYETGKGKVVLKADCEIINKKGHSEILVKSIPYGIVKDQLVKKIIEIKLDKKIDGIADVIDESDYENMARLVIELKKDANPELVLKYLYKNTDLQTNYNFNMVAIVDKRPKYVGILDIIDAFIAHQKEVVTRRTKYDKNKAEERLNVLNGVMRALSILDDVIKVIRASKNKADSIDNLMKKFDFNYEQAKYIVEMQLYRLTNTDILDVQNEIADLEKKIEVWGLVLSNPDALKHVMTTELKLIKKEYGNPRRTIIKDEVQSLDIDMKAMVPSEDVIVTLTHDGYIKRTSFKSYSASTDKPVMKDNDYNILVTKANTRDYLLVFTSLGNYLYIPVYKIFDLKWKDMGKHISNIINLSEGEVPVSSFAVKDFNENINIMFISKNGMIKKSPLKDFDVSRYSKPIVCMKLKDGDRVVDAFKETKENIFISTHSGYGLSFNCSDVPVTGTRSSGVKAITLKNDYVVSANLFGEKDEYISLITDRATGKRIRLSEFELMTRSRKGLLILREVKSKPYKVLKTFITDSKEMIGLKNSNIEYFKVTDLPILDRYSTGKELLKSKIDDAFIECKMEDDSVSDTPVKPLKEIINLDDVDKRLMTIDDFLK